MSGAIPEVDELNDYSASTVVPAESSDTERPAPAECLMLCSYCAQALTEIKTKGSFGPCACCGIPEPLSGPVTESEVRLARERLERMAEIGEGLEQAGLANAIRADMVAAGYQAPAARIITPGIDDVLDAIESEEDVVNANRELLEGRPLTKDESAKWQRLVNEILREANKRLKAKGVVLISAVPEPNGLGAVFVGCDSVAFEAAERGVSMPSDEYLVTFTLPARERVDIQRASNEDFVRWALDLICAECIEQQKAYRAKAGMH